jgi:hypothetical protein
MWLSASHPSRTPLSGGSNLEEADPSLPLGKVSPAVGPETVAVSIFEA